MGLEAAGWGALVALNTAFVNPLLLSRGAEALALGIYSSGASLFGLGAGVLGPRAAARAGSGSRVMVLALLAARSALLFVPFTLVFTPEVALPLLIAVLLVWSAGEGIALPLWTAYLAELSDPVARARWFAARATTAAMGAAIAILPMLLLARLSSPERVLQVAYAVAALAAVMSALQVRALLRLAPPPSPPPRPVTREASAALRPGFFGGVFAFWFGAALNRPVLPPYIVDDLHAPAAYFATAAVVAAVAGAGLQRWWGSYGGARGARSLLGLSGLGCGLAPVLWACIPDYRFGVPLEAFAAGCWLGHLLGITLHAVEVARDDAERASVIAGMQMTQGSAAALAPLLGAGLMGMVGAVPLLVASGLICLGATVVMTGDGLSAISCQLSVVGSRIAATKTATATLQRFGNHQAIHSQQLSADS